MFEFLGQMCVAKFRCCDDVLLVSLVRTVVYLERPPSCELVATCSRRFVVVWPDVAISARVGHFLSAVLRPGLCHQCQDRHSHPREISLSLTTFVVWSCILY
jgi:hypothetical protein